MTISLPQVWPLATVDTETTVRFIILLRYVLAGLALLALLGWHFLYASNQQWAIALISVLTVLFWSTLVLNIPSLQNAPFADLREMLVDTVWIAAVLLYCGGATNPVIYYFLVIIALSATVLTRPQAWAVCVLSIALYTALLLKDLQMHFQHFETTYKIHLVGMWANYLFSAVITCYFISNLILHIRMQHEQMLQFRENNLKNEQIIGLATVAATAVHNLATPLSTLHILVNEMSLDNIATRSYGSSPNSKHELDTKNTNNQTLLDNQTINVMREQISRCETTIKELSMLAKSIDINEVITVCKLVDLVQHHYSLNVPESSLDIRNTVNQHTAINCNSLLHHALINLINNAIQSSCEVTVVIFYTKKNQLIVDITNISSAEETVIWEHWGTLNQSEKSLGLGIGSLLANSTIEQQGGTVSLKTQAIPNIKTTEQRSQKTQITVTVVLPLACISSAGVQGVA